MKRILAAVDFSDVTEEVVSEAATLASAFGSTLYLLHVVGPTPDLVGYYSEAGFIGPAASMEDMKVHMEQARERLAKVPVGGKMEVERRVEAGSPILEVIRQAEDLEADLIVLGSHGHGAIYHLLLGSVSEGVLHRAHCPVLIVHHQGKRTSTEPVRENRAEPGFDAPGMATA